MYCRDLPRLRRQGGSAEDADSEGVEGKFSDVWTPEQLYEVLGPDSRRRGRPLGRSRQKGTEKEATILNRMHTPGEFARSDSVEDLRLRLFDAHEQRVRPGLDDKVLTEWNALMRTTWPRRVRPPATGRGSRPQSQPPVPPWQPPQPGRP